MSKNKTKTKPELAKLIKEAKKRLSTRMVLCEKCFSPRNTLTVKHHVNEIWFSKDIEITDKGVNLPCKGCQNKRFLSLGEISFRNFQQESQDFHIFVLLKDGKYNCLVGVSKVDKTLFIQDGEVVIK